MSKLTECSGLTPNDVSAVKNLWSICFNDTPQFVDWYFREYYRAEDGLGIKKDEQLLAAAQVVPYELQVRGKKLPVGYVVGVMTAPEGRNLGYAKSLLYAGLVKMREANVPLSILMPFEGQFYYRYGWNFCYFQQWYQIKSEDLSCLAAAYGEVREIPAAAYVEKLGAVYQTMMEKRYHGYAYRNIKDWQNLFADYALEGAKWYLLEVQGNCEGYMLCLERDNRLLVQEIAYTNKNAYHGMLAYLKQQGKALEIHTGPDDELAYWLAKSKEGVMQYPFLMARIVDVEQCLKSITYPVDCAGCVFAVKDEFASWNEQNYYFAVKDGQATVMPVAKKAQLTIDIYGLTMLVMGAASAERLACDGHIETADESLLAVLNSLWPVKNNYLNAYY